VANPIQHIKFIKTRRTQAVIQLLFTALLGSALILSICALWLAVKELMAD
jgi:hypothetical protein